MVNKALFLDRDGVINYDYGYVHSKENFVFVEGIFDLTLQAVLHSYEVFVVTNQAGIGKNIFSEKTFLNFQKKYIELLNKKKAIIDDIIFCPFHPYAKIKKYKVQLTSCKIKLATIILGNCFLITLKI